MKHVLIAEDDVLIAQMMEFRLQKNGYQVSCVTDGLQAIAFLKTNTIDALITDIMMPFASGMEIISFVRNTLNKKFPIIVLSGAGLEQTVLEAFELGADDFVNKPFSPDELQVRLKRLLK